MLGRNAAGAPGPRTACISNPETQHGLKWTITLVSCPQGVCTDKATAILPNELARSADLLVIFLTRTVAQQQQPEQALMSEAVTCHVKS